MLAYQQPRPDRDRIRDALRDPAADEPVYVHHGQEIWKAIPRFTLRYDITPELMAEITRRLSLAEYVERYTALSDRGGFMRGACPYCTGGDCEIVVIEDSRLRPPHYLCISASGTGGSCRARGNVIGLQMRMRNIGFAHAVLDLCDDADIPPPALRWEF